MRRAKLTGNFNIICKAEDTLLEYTFLDFQGAIPEPPEPPEPLKPGRYTIKNARLCCDSGNTQCWSAQNKLAYKALGALDTPNWEIWKNGEILTVDNRPWNRPYYLWDGEDHYDMSGSPDWRTGPGPFLLYYVNSGLSQVHDIASQSYWDIPLEIPNMHQVIRWGSKEKGGYVYSPQNEYQHISYRCNLDGSDVVALEHGANRKSHPVIEGNRFVWCNAQHSWGQLYHEWLDQPIDQSTEEVYLDRGRYRAAISSYQNWRNNWADNRLDGFTRLCFEHGHMVNGVLIFSVGLFDGAPTRDYWICRYDGSAVEVLAGPVNVDLSGSTGDWWWRLPKPSQSPDGTHIAYQSGNNIEVIVR